jgi:inner membrane protein
MDPITHGLIGATSTIMVAQKEKLRTASLVGAAGAMLPDLDVLINSASDPLLQLEYHRQFTHSFLFAPVGALITAIILWWFIKKRFTFKETYFYSLLGMATAGIADTFTSYGVQLLWPFTDIRFAWNLVSVFDPLFSLGLVIAVTFALSRRNREFARLGFVWMALYLLFGLNQQHKTETAAQKLAQQRGHSIQKLIVKPTIANEVLWSIRYVSSDSLHTAGIRLLPFTEPQVFQGNSAPMLDWKQEFAPFKGTTLYKDISRFAKLSNGVLIAHPDSAQVIGDGRYAMLPISVKPLWGIKIDTTNADQHVLFKTYRNATPKVRAVFKDMLSGSYPY